MGKLAPGLAADVVALGADPLADIGSLRRVRIVALRGTVVFEAK
jgi:imidazolonepropionase-like amidohydrolase